MSQQTDPRYSVLIERYRTLGPFERFRMLVDYLEDEVEVVEIVTPKIRVISDKPSPALVDFIDAITIQMQTMLGIGEGVASAVEAIAKLGEAMEEHKESLEEAALKVLIHPPRQKGVPHWLRKQKVPFYQPFRNGRCA